MVPPQKISKARKRKRRAHQALRAVNLTACPRCQAAREPHCACAKCGYAGRKVYLPPKTKEK